MNNPIFDNGLRLAFDSGEPGLEAVQKVQKPSKNPKADAGSEGAKELKIVDRVKLYSGVVPDLQNAKEKLGEILKQDYNTEVVAKLNEFVDQLESFQMAMLEFAKLAVQSDRAARGAVTTDAPATVEVEPGMPEEMPVRITAGMINGTEPLPE